MAVKRRKTSGRYWVAFWLAVFLVVAATVVARQQAAFETAAALRRVKENRGALEARQAELERRIRVGSTAEALLPKVGRLGLTLPHDTASTILVVGGEAGPPRVRPR